MFLNVIFVISVLCMFGKTHAVICPEIAVSGSNYQAMVHGIYTLLEEDLWCEGHPAYSRSGNQFLFVTHLDTWAIGAQLCGADGSIHHPIPPVYSGPDDIIKPWAEFTGIQWQYNMYISVECAQCSVLELNGATATGIQQENEGIYTKQEGSECGGRATYIKTTGVEPNYIYYKDNHTNVHGDNTWTADWLVGPGLCKDAAGIYSDEPAYSANKVTASWLEYSGGDTWVESPVLWVKCAECEEILVNGSEIYPEDNGYYEKLTNVRSDNRPVYMKTGPYIRYIYYVHKYIDSDGDIQVANAWVISHTPHDTWANSVAYEAAMTPDMVENPWLEHDGRTREFQESRITVTCANRQVCRNPGVSVPSTKPNTTTITTTSFTTEAPTPPTTNKPRTTPARPTPTTGGPGVTAGHVGDSNKYITYLGDDVDHLKLALGLAIPLAFLLGILITILVLWCVRRRKKKQEQSVHQSHGVVVANPLNDVLRYEATGGAISFVAGLDENENKEPIPNDPPPYSNAIPDDILCA